MSTLAYDISTFALKNAVAGVIIFNHLATREVVITSGYGWVETPPSADVNATFHVNGVEVSGAGVLIETDGTVTVTVPNPLTLDPGEHLQATMDADASVPVTKASGVAITLVATEGSDCYSDNRYDVGFYIEGLIPAGRTVAAAVVPRQLHIKSDVSWGTVITNATTLVSFEVRKNGSSIGSLVVQPNGAVVFMLTNGVQNFVAGDLLSIFAPGTLGQYVDATLQDLSVTFKGFLGPG